MSVARTSVLRNNCVKLNLSKTKSGGIYFSISVTIAITIAIVHLAGQLNSSSKQRVIEKNYIILMCDMTNNGITMKIQHVAYVGIQNVLRKFPVAGSKTDCDIHPL